MLTFPLRNVFRHRLRTGLTLAAIVFGVVGIVISGGFVEDVYIQLRENTIHSQLGHVQVFKSGYQKLGRRDPYKYVIGDSEALVNDITGAPHVIDVMRRVDFTGLGNNGRADLPIVGQGVEPAKESRLGTAIIIADGRELEDDDFYGVMVGKGVAAALKLRPGDYLTLLSNTSDGALNSLEFTVIGIFQTYSKDYDNRAVRIPLPAAQELVTSEDVHSLVLSLDDTANTDVVADGLRVRLGSAYEVTTWYEIADFYKKTVDLYRRQFGTLQVIILVMVLLSVNSSVNMSVFERVGEFGTLMALGDSKRRVFHLILVENTLLGIIGASAGLVVGIALAHFLSSIGIPMPPPPNSDVGYTAMIRIVPWVVATAFAVGLAATILAALIPAYRVVRTPLADALRRNV